jgi:surface polysaccharide O-acyltransferase-like enzyme
MSYHYVIGLLKSQPTIRPHQKVYIDLTRNKMCVDILFVYFGNIGRCIANKMSEKRKHNASRESIVDFLENVILLHIETIKKAQNRGLSPLLLSTFQQDELIAEYKRLFISINSLFISYQNDTKTCKTLKVISQKLLSCYILEN